MNLTCDSTFSSPTYSWSTSLTNGDGSSIEDEQSTITGKYLHGNNAGTHTCTAKSGGQTEKEDYEISLQGIF